MIIDESMPGSFLEARDVIRFALGTVRSLVLQAGHFMLYHDIVEDQLVPCVTPLLTGPRHEILRRSLGNFPVLSWQLALNLLDELPDVQAQALILVNDWQYCPPEADRSSFYRRYDQLPPVFRDPLEARAGRVGLLEPDRDRTAATVFFSELRLRNQYRKRFARMLKDQTLPEGVSILQEEEGVTCSLDDILGRREAIYCSAKGANCTMEVAELIRQVGERTGCTAFLNVFPGVCREYVMAGTELAFRLFPSTITEVINVALPATDIETETDFWRAGRIIHHRRP
jgi:hypothetical protein